MEPKYEALLDTLKHATSYATKRSRSSLIESLFYLFGHATNHTIARILVIHNPEIHELLQTWQARMGGLDDRDFPKLQVEVAQFLDTCDIDNVSTMHNRISIETNSVLQKFNVTSVEAGINALLTELSAITPKRPLIRDSTEKGQFILDLE